MVALVMSTAAPVRTGPGPEPIWFVPDAGFSFAGVGAGKVCEEATTATV